MIFLIGGSVRSGKSTLATKLGRRFRCPVISTDWLRSIALPYVDEKDRAVLEAILFPGKESEKVDAEFLELGVLRPAIESFIIDKSRWEGDFVLEGKQITPELVKKLTDGDKSRKIYSIFLVKTNVEKVLRGFRQTKKVKGDWLLEKHHDDNEYLLKKAKYIASSGRSISNEAKRNGLRVASTNDNFDGTLNDLVVEIADMRKKMLKAHEPFKD